MAIAEETSVRWVEGFSAWLWSESVQFARLENRYGTVTLI